MRFKYPCSQDFDDEEEYEAAVEAYEEYESEMEDIAMERYYLNKYGD